MNIRNLLNQANEVKDAANDLLVQAHKLESTLQSVSRQIAVPDTVDPFILGLTVFVLACFVGYYVVWKVTPALHSPLMSVTNAISSVIIVGALIAAGPAMMGISTTFGVCAVFLAAINIFGGFIVTQRMLAMFSKNK